MPFIALSVLDNPHQYTLRSLLIRTPGGPHSYFKLYHPGPRRCLRNDFYASIWCLRGQWSKKNNIVLHDR